LSIDDSDLEVLPFTITIVEEGGMTPGDLTVNWAYMRNGVILPEGSSNDMLPFISTNDEYWSYSGSLDFTQGVNVSLEDGDSIIWWIEVIDMAGNSASGTGMSMIDAMEPQFTILSFDITVTNIEIALANGSTPTNGKVVEGEEIGVIVYIRNLGTKTGTVKISLMEDLREDRNWLEHGSAEITLAPGQTLPAVTLTYETHGSGYQNLAVNITGMDRWINNAMLPHCAGFDGNASCDLDVESDMPMVISNEEANSGVGSIGFWFLVMGLLLAGMAVSIIVLLRRDKGESELYFDDDESWDDEEEEFDHKVTPILPPLAPEKPVSLDVLSQKLEVDNAEEIVVESEPEVEIVEEVPEPIEVEEDVDPWGDVDYSEIEEEKAVEEKTVKEKPKLSKTKLSKMKKAELVELAKEKGLSTKGTKSDLVERLRE